jgi:hypothetical protein
MNSDVVVVLLSRSASWDCAGTGSHIPNYIYNLHPIFAISLQSVHDNYWVWWYVLFVFFLSDPQKTAYSYSDGTKKTKTGVPRSPCLGKNSFLSLVYPAGIIQRACHIHKNMLMYPCVNVFLNLYIMHSESILHSRWNSYHVQKILWLEI